MPGTYVQVKARVANRVCRRGYLRVRISQRRTCCNRILLPNTFTPAFRNRTYSRGNTKFFNVWEVSDKILQTGAVFLDACGATPQTRATFCHFWGQFYFGRGSHIRQTEMHHNFHIVACTFLLGFCAVMRLTRYCIGVCSACAGELRQFVDELWLQKHER